MALQLHREPVLVLRCPDPGIMGEVPLLLSSSSSYHYCYYSIIFTSSLSSTPRCILNDILLLF